MIHVMFDLPALTHTMLYESAENIGPQLHGGSFDRSLANDTISFLIKILVRACCTCLDDDEGVEQLPPIRCMESRSSIHTTCCFAIQ